MTALGSSKIWILVPDWSMFKSSEPNAGHVTRKINPLYFNEIWCATWNKDLKSHLKCYMYQVKAQRPPRMLPISNPVRYDWIPIDTVSLIPRQSILLTRLLYTCNPFFVQSKNLTGSSLLRFFVVADQYLIVWVNIWIVWVFDFPLWSHLQIILCIMIIYSCNKMTTTWIQISHQNYKWLLRKF